MLIWNKLKKKKGGRKQRDLGNRKVNINKSNLFSGFYILSVDRHY